MNKPQKIVVGLLIGILALITIVTYRYNLTFGETVYDKSLMAGCMYKVLRSENYTESKNKCECFIGNLIEKYSEEEIRNDIDKIIVENKSSFDECLGKDENINPQIASIDTTKLYQKIGWQQIDEDVSQEVEAYVSKKNDTLINQYKTYKKGVLDSSLSKFYELKIEGYKDSLIQGEIRFFSPRDSMPLNQVESREVTFIYLQRENDSLVFKEIKTDTNFIKFPYRNFDDYTFVGFISDYRFITTTSSDSLLLNRNLFAIDSEASTDNTFVELLK